MIRTNRREVLGTLGALPLLGIASCASSRRRQQGGVDAVTRPTVITTADQQEFARLRALDLNDPKVVASHAAEIDDSIAERLDAMFMKPEVVPPNRPPMSTTVAQATGSERS